LRNWRNSEGDPRWVKGPEGREKSRKDELERAYAEELLEASRGGKEQRRLKNTEPPETNDGKGTEVPQGRIPIENLSKKVWETPTLF